MTHAFDAFDPDAGWRVTEPGTIRYRDTGMEVHRGASCFLVRHAGHDQGGHHDLEEAKAAALALLDQLRMVGLET